MMIVFQVRTFFKNQKWTLFTFLMQISGHNKVHDSLAHKAFSFKMLFL